MRPRVDMLRRTFFAAVVAALLWALAVCAPAQTVTIYHTSDLHEQTGNLARIAKFVNDRRARDPNVLLVDSGDWFNRGDMPIMFTRGEGMIHLLRTAGYDALTLGNHDWSFGTARTAALIDKYKLPVLAANVVWPKDAAPKTVLPYRIFPLQGVTVGVIGVTTEGVDHRTDDHMKVTPPEKMLAGAIAEVRKKADVVVVISHVGIPRDRRIAENIAGIDAILGGHDHLGHVKTVRGGSGPTQIQHSRAYGLRIGKVVLECRGRRVVRRSGGVIQVRPDMAEDPAVKALREKYFAALPLNEPIAQASQEITPEQLAAWLGQVLRESLKVDAAVLPKAVGKKEPPRVPAGAAPPKDFNPNPLAKGRVTYGELLARVPRLGIATFEVSGAEALGDLLVRLNERAGGELVLLAKDALEKNKPVRVAYPCVAYDRILSPAALGLRAATVRDVRRVPEKSLWQVVIEYTRKHGTIAPPKADK